MALLTVVTVVQSMAWGWIPVLETENFSIVPRKWWEEITFLSSY